MGTLKIPALKQYILRKLGHPVINIEIDNTQLDDCIDEALKTFLENHYDAVDIGYVGVEVSAGTGYYTLPDSIQGVLECLNIEGQSSSSLWIDDDPLLILRPGLHGGHNIEPEGFFDVTSVEVMRQRMALWEDTYKTHILFEFNDVTKRLTFPETPTSTGTRILKVVQAAVDTEDTSTVSDSLWLKKYAVALARVQWGVNLDKYEGAQLPGGVTINASGILEKGEADIEKLLVELDEKYTEPPDPVYA